jgi:hypothetical protein
MNPQDFSPEGRFVGRKVVNTPEVVEDEIFTEHEELETV